MERGIFVPMMIPAFPDNPCGGGGAGTVTSVGITAPAIFAVTNSPVTTTGVIDIALVAQSPNLVFASPTTGAPAAPTFRTLVAPDLGTGTATVSTVLRGDMTWGSVPIDGWTPSLETLSPNNVVNASRLLVNSTSVNGDAVIQPKGNGAFLTSLPDSTAVGGNKRGQYAVDLQMFRSLSTKVAQGNYSVIAGGEDNRASSQYTTVSGGYNNTAGGDYSVVAGGHTNTTNGLYAVALGGLNNTASASYATVAGGFLNTASDTFATIVGGTNSAASGEYSSILGGGSNIAAADYSTVLGGSANGTVVGADNSIVHGANAVARRKGEHVHGYGIFGTSGSNQKETVLLLGTTTTNTPQVLTIDGTTTLSSANLLRLYDGATSYAFRGLVTAVSSTPFETCTWEIKGGVTSFVPSLGTGPALVGCPQIITLGDNTSGAFSISIDVNVTYKALIITVTGVSGRTIRWGAFVDLMQVSFAI